ncbi:hypothetical protein GCM10028833_17130 [Glycomyces tarimensis]
MRDMALSLAVLLVPLGIFYWAWNWASPDREVSVVNTAEDYMSAESLGLDPVEPELSDDWKAISSALATADEAVTLRTGWYSPDGHGLQLVQTNGPVDEVHDEIDGAGEPVTAGGTAWSAYDIADGEAWVAELGGSTIVLLAEPDAVPELPELAEGVTAGLP